MILITGAAGFIGFHLCMSLLDEGFEVVGVDSINDYYDIGLKTERLNILQQHKRARRFVFQHIDLSSEAATTELFADFQFDFVVHLAAQAGVRYSIENPRAYVDANLVGFINILECCRNSDIQHLVYASSSSVYGMNRDAPFSTAQRADSPVSLYAATKRSNELMAFTYSHLFNIPATGLRFFTVYGPYGRPDMAYFKFTKSVLNGDPIDVYNEGAMLRDFTYVTDIVRGIKAVIPRAPERSESEWSAAPCRHKLYNLGNSNPVTLLDFIGAIEKACGKKAKLNLLPMQQGDVPLTYADMSDFQETFSFKPEVSIQQGIQLFVDWYLRSK